MKSLPSRRARDDGSPRRRGAGFAALGVLAGVLALAHQWIDFSPWVFLAFASFDVMGWWDRIPTPILATAGIVTLVALAVLAGEWVAKKTGGG